MEKNINYVTARFQHYYYYSIWVWGFLFSLTSLPSFLLCCMLCLMFLYVCLCLCGLCCALPISSYISVCKSCKYVLLYCGYPTTLYFVKSNGLDQAQAQAALSCGVCEVRGFLDVVLTLHVQMQRHVCIVWLPSSSQDLTSGMEIMESDKHIQILCAKSLFLIFAYYQYFRHT